MIRIGRHWWWLLLIATVVGVIGGDFAASRQQSLYAATAQLVINPKAGATGIDYGTTQGAQDLANTYQKLITAQSVLQPVVEKLNLPYGVDELGSKLTSEVV